MLPALACRSPARTRLAAYATRLHLHRDLAKRPHLFGCNSNEAPLPARSTLLHLCSVTHPDRQLRRRRSRYGFSRWPRGRRRGHGALQHRRRRRPFRRRPEAGPGRGSLGRRHRRRGRGAPGWRGRSPRASRSRRASRRCTCTTLRGMKRPPICLAYPPGLGERGAVARAVTNSAATPGFWSSIDKKIAEHSREAWRDGGEAAPPSPGHALRRKTRPLSSRQLTSTRRQCRGLRR
jgi:hypothetical protein